MVIFSFANPEIRIIEERGIFWAVAGIDEEGCRWLREGHEGNAEAEADLCRDYGDATIVKVHQTGGHARAITAWKGITSYHEIFYRILPGAEIVISDHFRNILSHVPVSDRWPSEGALCDHFLFRTVPGENTFCESVKRLGRGVRLEIDPASGTLTKTLFDKVENLVRPGSLNDYLGRIDGALENAMSPFRADDRTAMLFSGGVDSTLLQTYLSSTVPPVSYEFSHYAEDFEADYSSRSAALMDLELETHRVGTADFLQRLESVTSATALPPPHIQWVYFKTLFDLKYKRFIIGEHADAMFGFGARKARLGSYMVSPAAQLALQLVAPFAFGGLAGPVGKLRSTSLRLAQPPDSTDGYGALFGVYTNRPLVDAVFGRDSVRARLAARMAIVQERLEQTAPRDDAFLRHLETAHMMDYLCEDRMMCFRHLALAYGSTLFSPFIDKRVLESALSIPVGERYLRGFQGKYLLKRLLKRRLPAYPVDQKKGYMTAPFDEYYRSGPLSDVWRDYEVPELFQGEHRDRVRNQPSQMTWNAITLSIWRDKVGRNTQLQPIAGSKSFSWSDRPLRSQSGSLS